MPTIVYQSLNSNSSKKHGVKASKSQPFTKMAHEHSLLGKRKHWGLDYPTAPDVKPQVPVQGPPNLVRTASLGFKGLNFGDDIFSAMIGEKMRQTHQIALRNGTACDVMVLGELDGSHADWSNLADDAGTRLDSSTYSGKACQCFTVYSSNSTVKVLADGPGWLAVRCITVLVVFVHVPNAIAKNKVRLAAYYKDIANTLHKKHGGGIIDVIMGDTNQSHPGVSPEVVSAGTKMKFKNAHVEKTISPSDTFNQSYKGTNAKGTHKYDVAVYNTLTISSPPTIRYVSQFSPSGTGMMAVTDHMGMILQVDKV